VLSRILVPNVAEPLSDSCTAIVMAAGLDADRLRSPVRCGPGGAEAAPCRVRGRTAPRRASPRNSPGSSTARTPRRLSHRAPRACASACVCPPRSRSSAPSLRWLWPTERISGGHAVGAMPRSYQVTPAILGGGRHGNSRSDPTGPQANRESARRRPRAKPTSQTTIDRRKHQGLTEANLGSVADAGNPPCLCVPGGMPSGRVRAASVRKGG
jgi:hypothetical protein